MKLNINLTQNQSVDNYAIQRRASYIVIKAVITNSVTGNGKLESDPIQENIKNYQDNQLITLNQLEGIMINMKISGKKTTDIIKNLTLMELAKISQTLGQPVVVKSVDETIEVCIRIPLTIDSSSLGFNSQNILYLSINNATATSVTAYVIDTNISSNTHVLRYEREIIQQMNRKEFVEMDTDQQIKSNYVLSIFENLHEVEVQFENGEVLQFLPEELDILNDYNSKSQLIWNNECHSNFGNISSIAMLNVKKVAIQGIDVDKFAFFVRLVSL
jgi:hypothetical protein